MAVIKSDKELMRETRKLMGLTQDEMAEECGYASRMGIRDIESGRRKLSGPARRLIEELHLKARFKAAEGDSPDKG